MFTVLGTFCTHILKLFSDHAFLLICFLDSVQDKKMLLFKFFISYETIQNETPKLFGNYGSVVRTELWMKFVLWFFLAIVTCYWNCLVRAVLANSAWALATFSVCFLSLAVGQIELTWYRIIQLDLKKISNNLYAKFLGLIVDNTLSWKPHIDHLINKLSTTCCVIRSVMLYVNTNATIMIYHSLFHAVMTYGIIFWGNSSHSIQIFRMQKKAIGIIMGCGNRESCSNLFKELNILQLMSQYIFSLFTFVSNNRGTVFYKFWNTQHKHQAHIQHTPT